MLASFGLQCLKKAIKAKVVIIDEATDGSKLSVEERAKMIERIDPFVSLILKSFKTYHNPIIVTSLSIISQIVGMNLPSFKTNFSKFLNKIFKLFEQTQNSDTDFINSLLKCTSELIRLYSVFSDLSDV